MYALGILLGGATSWLLLRDTTLYTNLVGITRGRGADVVRFDDCAQTARGGDGLQALAIWQQWRPDLVVLDLMLPGLNGLDVLDALHRIRPLTF